MFKLKIQNKIILTTSLMFLAAVSISLLNLIPADASSNRQEWKPPRTSYSSPMGIHTYKYTVSSCGKYGVYDDRGFIIYYPQFDSIKEIPSSHFAVERNGQWGVLDGDGLMVVPIVYDEIKQLTYMTSRVKKNGLYGWINQYGQFIKIPQYSYLENMNYDLLSACIPKQGCGILSEQGDEILPLTQGGIIGWHGNSSYFSIFKNGKYGIIDIKGNKIIDPILPSIKTIDNNAIIIQDGKLRGLVRLKDAKTLLEPLYQKVEQYKQTDYYKMKNNGKWGVIDINGNIIYNCNYGPFEINRMMKKYLKK